MYYTVIIGINIVLSRYYKNLEFQQQQKTYFFYVKNLEPDHK